MFGVYRCANASCECILQTVFLIFPAAIERRRQQRPSLSENKRRAAHVGSFADACVSNQMRKKILCFPVAWNEISFKADVACWLTGKNSFCFFFLHFCAFLHSFLLIYYILNNVVVCIALCCSFSLVLLFLSLKTVTVVIQFFRALRYYSLFSNLFAVFHIFYNIFAWLFFFVHCICDFCLVCSFVRTFFFPAIFRIHFVATRKQDGSASYGQTNKKKVWSTHLRLNTKYNSRHKTNETEPSANKTAKKLQLRRGKMSEKKSLPFCRCILSSGSNPFVEQQPTTTTLAAEKSGERERKNSLFIVPSHGLYAKRVSSVILSFWHGRKWKKSRSKKNVKSDSAFVRLRVSRSKWNTNISLNRRWCNPCCAQRTKKWTTKKNRNGQTKFGCFWCLPNSRSMFVNRSMPSTDRPNSTEKCPIEM